MRIKVCGLRDTDNILEVTNLGVDYAGFIFYPSSPRYAADDISIGILDRIPSDVKKVGVFVNEDSETVKDTVNQFRLDFIQLHGNEPVDYCERFYDKGIKIIKAFKVDKSFDFKQVEEFNPYVKYFLFDTKSDLEGGSGKKFPWNILKKYTNNKPFFLSGGISLSDAEEILGINHPQLFGVDINSKFEISPGSKNVQQIEDFVIKMKGNQSEQELTGVTDEI